MTIESNDQLLAYRVILMALDEIVRAGASPRFDGDDSATNPVAFKQLVMQYAGGKVSEAAIEQALKTPLQDIAHKLSEAAVKKTV